jgi:hypothetical protein
MVSITSEPLAKLKAGMGHIRQVREVGSALITGALSPRFASWVKNNECLMAL